MATTDDPCARLHSVLFDASITREERITEIGRLTAVEECTAQALRDAANRGDWLPLNEYLIAAYFRPDRRLTALLCDVLDRRIPEVNNEDLVDVLGEIRDVAAVGSLGHALRWRPDWDEFHGLAVKCVWAIEAIGGPEGKELLQEAARHGPYRVRAMAADALAQL